MGSITLRRESHDEQRVAGKSRCSSGCTKTARKVINKYIRLGALAGQMLLTPVAPKWYGSSASWATTKTFTKNNLIGGKIPTPKSLISQSPRRCQIALRSRMFIHALSTRAETTLELFHQGRNIPLQATLSGSYNSLRYMRLRNGNKEVIAFINPSLTSELKDFLPGKCNFGLKPRALRIVAWRDRQSHRLGKRVGNSPGKRLCGIR